MLEQIKNKFSELRQTNPHDLLVGAIFCAMLALPAFFAGGNSAWGRLIFYLLLFCQIILLWKSRKKIELSGGPAMFFLFLALFTVLMGVSIFYSPEKYQGLLSFCNFLAVGILSLIVYGFGATKERAVGLSCFTICLGVVLSLVGIYFFLFSQNYIYLRLNSTFDYHIPFGEFLGYPVLISFCLLLLKQWRRRTTIILILLNSFFFTTIFFNHCRGAWISMLAVAGMIAVIFLKKISWKRAGFLFGITGILAAVSIFAVMQIKSFQAAQASATAIYGNISETGQENALTARLAYWGRAIEIFKDHPLIGGGIESYRNLYQVYNVPPFYYSENPHNIYLKVLAELGAAGILFFAGFVLVLVFTCLRLIWRGRSDIDFNDDFAIIKVAFAAAIINALLNNFFGFGFSYLANSIFFFFFSGVVINMGWSGFDIDNSRRAIIRKTAAIKFAVPYSFLLLPALILFAGATIIFISEFYYKNGVYLITTNDYAVLGRQELDKAIAINPINPVYKKMAASWDLAQMEKNRTSCGNAAVQAEKLITEALPWSYNADILYLQGKLRLLQGNEAAASESFDNAVKVDPWEFDSYVELVQIYDRQGRYRDINTLLDKILPYWNKNDIISVFSMIFDKKAALEKAAYLHYMNSKAYEKENDPQKSQEENVRSLDYSEAARNYKP